MAEDACTPANALSRDRLYSLLRNNKLEGTADLSAGVDVISTGSPLRHPGLKLITKRLFQSPGSPFRKSPSVTYQRENIKKLRRHSVLPAERECVQRVRMMECEREACTPNENGEKRRKMLMSLIHYKYFSIDSN